MLGQVFNINGKNNISLTFQQFIILTLVHKMEINTISQLAALLNLSKSSLSLTLSKMEQENLLKKTPAPKGDDGRKVYLCITQKGLSALEEREQKTLDFFIEYCQNLTQEQKEAYILRSIQNAMYDWKTRYFPYSEDQIRLFIEKGIQKGYESEIFMDIKLAHYPLRDWTGLWNEMKSIVNSYRQIGKRNENAISHDKLGKHMAHLIRLYMMCIDILEKEEIITYRTKEHALLMEIRNGAYLDQNRQPTEDFYDILNEYEKRFEYAKKHTSLPDVPDYKRIDTFRMEVNERIVKGEF